MKHNNYLIKNLTLSLALAGVLPSLAGVVAHFPMDVKSGQICEAITGDKFDVKGNFGAEEVAGAVGSGLMFDGYSTYVDSALNNLFNGGSQSMTASVWMAVPCYPIIEIDVNTKEKATIVSCVDDNAKKGFGFYLGMDGKVEFKLYTGGWPISVESTKAVPPYQWNNLTAVLDGATHTLKLYCNGEEIGTTRCNGNADAFSGTLRFGHGVNDRKAFGTFNLQTFNGIVDEFKIWDEALSPEAIKEMKPENECDLSIPGSRFADQKLRPRFHGMPGAGWTNESHGLIKSDGRYHIFFQKNANGPYMARLHWGHISSDNLYDWREEKIAFAPEASYDFKGCWSGAVFTDEQLTGGKPSAIYTAVDYAKATIAQANPVDDSLIEWKKNAYNPIINGRPAGLSDDFRDPYFFRNGEKAYIIVGSSKDNKGVATLHRYQNGVWTNDGTTFFSSNNASTSGRFWEMPNVTKMENGKWLFTTTPLDMSGGVRTLYWTGDINDNGTFAPDANSSWPRQVELISKEGYGLLSPSIYQENGKTIALGIVPDKLPGVINHQLGWAHCYSLPREWSIDNDGNLSQKPYEGLKGMRAANGYSKADFSLNGVEHLSPVEGRQAELLIVAEADSSEFGFNIFKGSTGEGKISINTANSRLTVDLSGLQRHHNDDNVYNGVYTCSLPSLLKKGEDVTLNVFIDGSVLDIFINNRWATSIRVFPTADDADGIEAFATSPTKVKILNAWNLQGGLSGITDIFAPGNSSAASSSDVYRADGVLVRTNADPSNPLADLPKGIYVVGGKTMIK
ncbi:MAG: GH32 C-terminal domain-containing protein [Muribaculaceae bacterium]|nr:GH32 C-terminal domain-containing protein [Muribaculaceae bacterium]